MSGHHPAAFEPRLASVGAGLSLGSALGTRVHQPPLWWPVLLVPPLALLVVLASRSRRATAAWLLSMALVCGLALGLVVSARVDGALLARMAVNGPISVRAEVEAAEEARPAEREASVLEATVRRIEVGDRSIRLAERVLLVARGDTWSSIQPGERLRVEGELRRPSDAAAGALRSRHVVVLLVVRSLEERARPGNPVLRATNAVRSTLRRGAAAGLHDERAALLTGLLTGDGRGLSDSTRDDLRAAGLSHLIVVSGENVAWVMGAALLVLRAAGAPWPWRMALLALTLMSFVALTGWEPSVLRAAGMAGVALLAAVMGRGRPGPGDLLSAALIGLVALDPFLVWSPGLQLSVAATLGLLLLAPRLRRRLPTRPRRLFDAVAFTLAAQLAVTPLLVLITGRVSVVGLVANLLALPAAAVASVWGFPACLGSAAVPALAGFLHLPTRLPLAWVLMVARRLAVLPLGELRPSAVDAYLLGAVAALVVAIFLLGRRRLASACAMLLVLVVPATVMAGRTSPPATLRLVALDVGQGDAVLLRAPGGSILFDGGPDPEVVLRRLASEGVLSLDLVVLTHRHLDHVGGLVGVVRRLPVGAVLEGASPENEHLVEYAEFEREVVARGIPRRVVSRGDVIQIGDVALDVLAPVRPAQGTHSDLNNSSVVLRARVPGATLLLMGDAEVSEQDEILAAVGPTGLRADVLKVAHHGSSYQSAAALAAIDPKVAVISVGRGNPYHHPSSAVIDALAAGGAVVRRTDLDGSISISVALDGTIVVGTSRENPQHRGP